ncbi:conserved exported hypothetical protein [Candidatus Sulfopaludibacter sp. SbA4]|nr:conserved exported hypothetical protein [Candidatus Sulfopaludibacter sp. SbA4]
MQPRLMIAALGSLSCLIAADPKPTVDQQTKTLEAAREIAIHYTSKLPNFVCNEQVERATSNARSPLAVAVVQRDKLTIQLTFAGEKEQYKLVAMNGEPTTQPLESLDGIITGGEFGSQLLGIFDRASAATFQWKEWTILRKRRAAVYTYRIARDKSHYLLGRRADNGAMQEWAAGYQGEVVLDNETNKVLRLTASANDIPKQSEIDQSSLEVDYDFVEVAGTSHLLPSHSESRMERANRKISNVVTFTGYKKFEADSTISFK